MKITILIYETLINMMFKSYLYNIKILRTLLQKNVLTIPKCNYNIGKGNNHLKVMFFGTDEFSLASLKSLSVELNNGTISSLGVVTTFSKTGNPVLKYAKEKSLTLYGWPLTVSNCNYDIGLVVSFGHLIPEKIINIFPYGMINVHASLLPRWRGAAPIVYSIMNGDTETGVTIMRIRPKHFDVGEIIKQKSVVISEHMLMPELREKLAEEGSKLLIDILKEVPTCIETARQQPSENCSYAPKINSSIAVIKWNDMTALQIYNLHRAVSGVFALTSNWHETPTKLFGCTLECNNTIIRNLISVIEAQNIKSSKNINLDEKYNSDSEQDFRLQQFRPGRIYYNKHNKLLYVLCKDNSFVSFNSIGIGSKKPMSASDFNNGFMKKRKSDQHFLS